MMAAGEVDTYTFSGATRDMIVVRMGSAASGLNPHVRLFDPTGVQICAAHSYGVAAEIGACVLPQDGIYTVLLNDLNDAVTGAYGIVSQRLNHPLQTTALAFGRSRSGHIADYGGIDTYTFNAYTGAVLRIQMSSMTPGLNPAVRVYDPDGVRICEAATYGTMAEISTCVLPETGTYAILVSDAHGADTGFYRLTLTCLDALCGPADQDQTTIYLPLVIRM